MNSPVLNVRKGLLRCPVRQLSGLALVIILAGQAAVADDSWYFGIGAGLSTLRPRTADSSLAVDSTNGTYAGFLLGRNLSYRLAAEALLHLPGRGEIGSTDVDYQALDLGLRYRFLQASLPAGKRAHGYLFAGFGSINRDAESALELDNETRFHFSAGLGAALQVNPAVSLRMQVMYLDEDVQFANVSLLWHWGHKIRSTALASAALIPDATPAVDSAAGAIVADEDNDGIADAADQCDKSLLGYPVRENGCAQFDGVLQDLTFTPGTTTLAATSYAQLDALVTALKNYPDTIIALLAHTDATGSIREQAILTRGRLRTIATYLSRNGVRANRLVLRSMGGSRPQYDNSSALGRRANNRIEILEYRP